MHKRVRKAAFAVARGQFRAGPWTVGAVRDFSPTRLSSPIIPPPLPPSFFSGPILTKRACFLLPAAYLMARARPGI